jgi:hypothetical protein
MKPKTDELASLDLLPQDMAQRRTDDLLRNLLNAPPDPHKTATKPSKTAPKKPRKK